MTSLFHSIPFELPTQLCLQTLAFDSSEQMLDRLVHSGNQLPEELNKACLKRKVEYLAGRDCARRALIALGAENHAVLIQADRSPKWPEGFLGALTHSNRTALAAVGSVQHFSAVGIDIEALVSPEQAQKLAHHILTPKDQVLGSHCPLPFATFFTLAFSAKESLYKLLYSRVQRFFGFEAAQFCVLDCNKHSFSLELCLNLNTELEKGCTFTGSFAVMGQQVLTILFLSSPP